MKDNDEHFLDKISFLYRNKLFVFIVTFIFVFLIGRYVFRKNDLSIEKIKNYFANIKENIDKQIKNVDQVISEKDSSLPPKEKNQKYSIKNVVPEKTVILEDPIVDDITNRMYLIKQVENDIIKKKINTKKKIKRGDYILVELDMSAINKKIGSDSKIHIDKMKNIMYVSNDSIEENFVKLLLGKSPKMKITVRMKDMLSDEVFNELKKNENTIRQNIKDLNEREELNIDVKQVDDITRASYNLEIIDILDKNIIKKYNLNEIFE